ncbi:MAG: ATP-binding cassette domain-containing protein, partial [Nitrososphaerota archaeon]
MISFEDVEYVYPSGVKALDGVSLKIEKGEIVALMGENGSGKTTLLKHLNGLLKPT